MSASENGTLPIPVSFLFPFSFEGSPIGVYPSSWPPWMRSQVENIEDRTLMAKQAIAVWYATPKKFHSLWRWSSRSQRGEIEVSPQRITFAGGETRLDLQAVQSVEIVNRPVPWLSLAIDNCLILLFIVGRLTSTYTLNNPATIPFVVIVNLVFYLMLRRIKWVDVEYCDESGHSQHAYFTDGSSFGRARALGGADQLCKLIRSRLHSRPGRPKQQKPSKPEQPMRQESSTPELGLTNCRACGAALGPDDIRCPDCDISLK